MSKQFYTKGMTLVEAVVAVGLFTILSLVLFDTIVALYENNAYSFAQADEVNNARRGLYAVAQDMREMTYGEDGTFPVVIMEPNRIGFYSDIDKDNSVEYVEYILATTTFFKHTHNPVGFPPVYDFANPDETQILSLFVQNEVNATSTFQYYDTNNVELDTGSLLTDVRYIKTQLIVNVDPLRSPGEFLLRTGVAPRNLKDNL